MNKLIAAVVLAVSVTSAAAPAIACGELRPRPVQAQARETATGVWPSVARKDGRVTLTLSYPKFTVSGAMTYMDSFDVVPDRNLRQLERAIGKRSTPDIDVTVTQLSDGRWRVVSWKTAA